MEATAEAPYVRMGSLLCLELDAFRLVRPRPGQSYWLRLGRDGHYPETKLSADAVSFLGGHAQFLLSTDFPEFLVIKRAGAECDAAAPIARFGMISGRWLCDALEERGWSLGRHRAVTVDDLLVVRCTENGGKA